MIVAQQIRKLDWSDDKKLCEQIGHAYSLAAAKVDPEFSGVADQRGLQQMQVRLIGNLKSLTRNNFVRVLTKFFRKKLGVKTSQSKFRPAQFLQKIALGVPGRWTKGTAI
jgi:hypothetical protein